MNVSSYLQEYMQYPEDYTYNSMEFATQISPALIFNNFSFLFFLQ